MVVGRELREVEGTTDAEVFGPAAAEIIALKTRALENARAQRDKVTMIVRGTERTYDLYVAPERGQDVEVVGVAFVALGVVWLFKIAAKEKGNSLPGSGGKSTFIFLDDLVAVITSLPVNEFHQYFSLVNRQLA